MQSCSAERQRPGSGAGEAGAEGGDDDEGSHQGDNASDIVEDGGLVPMTEVGKTFEEAFNDDIDLITEFLAGLKFQAQFRDQRMLNTLEQECACFFRLARVCLDKEKRMRKQGSHAPST